MTSDHFTPINIFINDFGIENKKCKNIVDEKLCRKIKILSGKS